MSDDGKRISKEYRKSFKKYDIVIDKTTVITIIVVVTAIFGTMCGIFYLAGVFK